MKEKIDFSKYEGHTEVPWCARNVGDGSPMSCDEDYEHDTPFMEMGEWVNPAIGYFSGGEESHSLEERRANIKLMADAPLLLEAYKQLKEELSEVKNERDKYDGALTIALEHLGYQGIDHEYFCKEKYGCNVYGDELEK